MSHDISVSILDLESQHIIIFLPTPLLGKLEEQGLIRPAPASPSVLRPGNQMARVYSIPPSAHFQANLLPIR